MNNNSPPETQLPVSTRIPHNKAPAELVSQVLDLVLQGQPVTHVARQFGITRQVIYNWIIREAQETREAKDSLYIARLDRLIERMLDEADNKDLSGTNLRDLVIAMGISMDKRERFYGPKANSSQNPIRLKIAWKDGEGAAELTVGSSQDKQGHLPAPQNPDVLDPLPGIYDDSDPGGPVLNNLDNVVDPADPDDNF